MFAPHCRCCVRACRGHARLRPQLLALLRQAVAGLRPQPPDVQLQAASCLAPLAASLLAPSDPAAPSLPPHTPAAAADDGAAPGTAERDRSDSEAARQALLECFSGLVEASLEAGIKGGDVLVELCHQLPELSERLGTRPVEELLLRCSAPGEGGGGGRIGAGGSGARGAVRRALRPRTAALVRALGGDEALRHRALALVLGGDAAEEDQGNEGGGVGGQWGGRGSGSGAWCECGSWRDRLALAQQLAALTAAASAGEGAGRGLGEERSDDALRRLLLPCAEALCSDGVWAVRHEAAAQLGRMLRLARRGEAAGAVLACVRRVVGGLDGDGDGGRAEGALHVAGAHSLVAVCQGFLLAGGADDGAGEEGLAGAADELRAAIESTPPTPAWQDAAARALAALRALQPA